MHNSVSVILTTRNEEKHIQDCINSVLEQDYPKNLLEILIIDGISTDKTMDLINEYTKNSNYIRIISNPHKITPKALNTGIKNAKNDILIWMSGHTCYSRNYISKCVEYLNKTESDSVGGHVYAKGTNYLSNGISFVLNSFFGAGGGKHRNRNYEGNSDTVFAGAWKKNTFDKYGFFNENLIRIQDKEFNSRIINLGGKIYITPEIRSEYYCRSNLKELCIQNFKTGFWVIKSINITAKSLSLRHFIPLFFILSLLITWITPALFLSIAVSYLVLNLLFSILISVNKGLKYLFILPIIFLCLHSSYGFGSLYAIFVFMGERIKCYYEYFFVKQ